MTVPVASYTVAKSGSQSTARPGDKVTYTITVNNTGQVDYTTADPASFTDDLSKVLDDATYDNDVTGGASYAAPVLSWSGALAVGQTKTFTYSVTVKDPDTGNGIIDNTVVPTGPAGQCTAADACQVTVPVESYTVAKTASQSTAAAGDTITYTITVVNTGQVDYTAANPASFTDDLSKVLDDATYNNDATGGVTYAAPVLSWSGALAVGQTRTFTYSVTVDEPDTGNKILDNTVVPTGPAGSCATPTGCEVMSPLASYTVSKKASRATALPGDQVTYTITVVNTGQVDYTVAQPASFADDLSKVLDDATYDDDVTGGATYSAPVLSWSGALAIGQTRTFTYSVTVKDPDTGDVVLDNTVVPSGPSGTCGSAGCHAVVPVFTYTVAKTASQSTAAAGDTITYTISVVNTGQVDYTAANPASFTDDLSKVLDDATYNNDATGGVTYAAPVLSWSGALAIGQTKTFTYSVTVKDPDTGNGILDNTVVPTGPAGQCSVPGGCRVTVPVASYTVAKSGSQSTAQPGDKVTYTITVNNTGQVDYTTANPASFTDDLSKVLDDATYDNDVTGGASYAAPVLSWSGALAVGQTKTFTYSVTVKDPDTGNGILDNTVVPTGPAGQCTAANACQVTIPVAGMTITKTITSIVYPNAGRVTAVYEIRVGNTGQVDEIYALTDTLAWGAGLAVEGVHVDPPAGHQARSTFNGSSDPLIASGQQIARGTVQVWRVTVTGALNPEAASSSMDCTLTDGENGTGLLNSATLNGAGTDHHASACEGVRVHVSRTFRTAHDSADRSALIDTGSADPATSGESTVLTTVGGVLIALALLVGIGLGARRTSRRGV